MIIVSHLLGMSQMLIHVGLWLLLSLLRLLQLLMVQALLLLLLLLLQMMMTHQVFSDFRRFRNGRVRASLLLSLPENADDDGEHQEEDEDGQADDNDEDRARLKPADWRNSF